MNGENWDIELVFQFYYFRYLFMLSGAERASEFPPEHKRGNCFWFAKGFDKSNRKTFKVRSSSGNNVEQMCLDDSIPSLSYVPKS